MSCLPSHTKYSKKSLCYRWSLELLNFSVTKFLPWSSLGAGSPSLLQVDHSLLSHYRSWPHRSYQNWQQECTSEWKHHPCNGFLSCKASSFLCSWRWHEPSWCLVHKYQVLQITSNFNYQIIILHPVSEDLFLWDFIFFSLIRPKLYNLPNMTKYGESPWSFFWSRSLGYSLMYPPPQSMFCSCLTVNWMTSGLPSLLKGFSSLEEIP